MICWVVERALAARNVARAIVATDDERIVDCGEVRRLRSGDDAALITRAERIELRKLPRRWRTRRSSSTCRAMSR